MNRPERNAMMPRIFITGSTDELGRLAAQSLMQDGHQVVLHARSPERAKAVADLTSRSASVVVAISPGFFCTWASWRNEPVLGP
jgi:short-subunit dehydrogenase